MASDNENHQYSVKILDVCRVAPHSSSSAPKSLPLTFFDIMLLRFPPTRRLFFYETETTSSSFDTIIVPKLKHSLSLILQHYLPLSGNLIWPQHSHKPVIQYLQCDSVSFTVAQSDDDDDDAHFHHLSTHGFRELALYDSLVPQLSVSDDRMASIAFQITRFQNSGFSIGITSNHMILDATALFPFIKSWAHICNNLIANSSSSSSIDLMPFYDRTNIRDPDGLEAIYLNGWLNRDGPNNRSLSPLPSQISPDLIRCTLEINGQTLKKLKQWVLKKKNQKSFHLSSFTVICAYIWVCVAKSKQFKDRKKMIFAFPVNARSRLEPPLPSNYFGNCLVARECCVDGNELLDDENGMMVAVDAISEEIKLLEHGVLKGAVNLVSFRNSENAKEERVTVIGGSPRFEVYDIDFGWGKPKKVEASIYLGTSRIYLSNGRNGDGGIQIELVRKRNEMETFTSLFAQGLDAISI